MRPLRTLPTPPWPALRIILPALLAGALLGCRPSEPPLTRSGTTQRSDSADAATARILTARLLQVQDGDSFVARVDGGGRRTIRLSGIDAPERSQPYADRSRQNLRRLLEGRALELQVVKVDQYGRAIALVLTDDGDTRLDVGQSQIEAGLAWFFRRYERDLPAAVRERYAQAEQTARAAGIGVWQAVDPEPPWDFRRQRGAVRPGADR